jgi:hypothetical protein
MSRDLAERNRIGKRQLKVILGLAAGIGLGATSYAHAQNVEPGEDGVDLFTTTSDFTGWSPDTNGKGVATASSTAYDWDLDTVNGLGNNPGNSGGSINPGGISPAGALQITANGNMGFSSLAFSPGEAYNPFFMTAIDPGSTAAFQPPGFSTGNTVAHSGTLLLTYSVPTFSAGGPGNGGYYELGLIFNYDNNFNFLYGPNGGVNDGTVDGYTTFTETIPYTINPTSLSFFNLGIAVNADGAATPSSPIYVDDIELQSVPEPASIGMLGAGLTLLTFRRRKASVQHASV